mmetsp:Transcript_20186/g.32722  ORF Transcript_20186/g.32722 Transcript_20186/m.32722 type:complete len:176 (-) Transcript_20186:307-834(-)|eukprot:CAMPEP_0196154134 /NCGR_PEP_ID=MMETSP0910-20130528/38373_1 /TAXON_ID=49265 /ORGANISM="Thalassiosira rotula, Strain GSO102" /LENGTH=175 /DNA_ID=CAMNT_0041418095 /DNA_START=202 /DNA_END=729 /DNA_ORIENTATION=-
MREGRRFILGFLLLVSLAILGLSNIPLVHADAVEDSSEETEAVVDATGDVHVEEPETPKEDEGDSDATAETAAQEAAAEAAARQAEAAAAAAKAEEEAAAEAAAAAAAAEVVEEVKDGFVGDVGASVKSKAMAYVDKAKEVTPEQLKKVAAGALGIWGVAAGAGWVMNNLGGAQE